MKELVKLPAKSSCTAVRPESESESEEAELEIESPEEAFAGFEEGGGAQLCATAPPPAPAPAAAVAEKVTAEEAERAATRLLEQLGFTRVKVITFTLPTEYIAQDVELKRENGQVVERRVLKADPAPFRAARRAFYAALHKIAWRSEVGWVAKSDADLSVVDEWVRRFDELARKYGLPAGERTVEVVEAWLPKDWVVRQLTNYIAERRAAYEKMAAKLAELKEKGKSARRALRELEKLREELRELEEELRRLMR